MIRLMQILTALLVVQAGRAATTVQVVGYTSSSGEFSIAVSGDSADVRLDVQGGAGIDVCSPGVSGVMVNDGVSVPTITIFGTSTCELMPHSVWPGLKGTVAGEQKDLPVGMAVVFGSVPTPPPPPTVTGDATLTWEWPTQNTDNSPLTDLVGGKVYWSTTVGEWPWSANVGLVNTYTVEDLPPGSWIFSVTAINSVGAESEHSDAAVKIIGGDPPPPDPVDCVVDDPSWLIGTPQPAICPTSGTQTRTDTRTLTVLIQPANGGLACPPLNETRTMPVTCTPLPTDPCVLRPLTFRVRSWPGGPTGDRSFGYSSNKPIVQFEWTWSGARLTGVTAFDGEGCSVPVTR